MLFELITTKLDFEGLMMFTGPGCSSIAYGASEEIGPFRINKTASSLYLNKYSWNNGLLFTHSPLL